jgi:ubiquinone biosynthesis protein
MTLDGVGKSLGMDLNIFQILEKNIRPIMKEVLSQDALKEELLWFGRDVMNSVKTLPRHVRWFLKDFSREKYSFKLQISNLDILDRSLQNSFYFIGMVFTGCVFVAGGIYFIPKVTPIWMETIPMISWVFWLIALFLFWHGHRSIRIR